MTSAAQQDSIDQGSSEEAFALQATGTYGSGALRQTVAERVAMHRSRRAVQAQQLVQDAAQRRADARSAARTGVSRVRDAVAARYQNSPSYREYLAAEAERALEEAQAEVEMANRKARAVAEAQLQLLEELEQWNQPDPGPREQALEQKRSEARGELAHALADIALGARELIREAVPAGIREAPETSGPTRVRDMEDLELPGKPLTEVSAGGLTVKLYNGLETAKSAVADLKRSQQRADTRSPMAPQELSALDEELELRHGAGLTTLHSLEVTPIPANLIEFPRQLIAPRKARPRLAEGPLREEGSPEPQLRIFEVEAEQIVTEPAPAGPAMASGWEALLLESTKVATHVPRQEAQTPFTLPLHVAPLGKRLFAAGVDGVCLLAALAGFAEVAIHLGGAPLEFAPRPSLAAAACGVLLALYAFYQLLFFTFTEATPGMRVARIALCTFGDDNPTRKAMRRRVLATFLAACPLGVGLFWSFLDEERLGWHDRMSRMYQRAY